MESDNTEETIVEQQEANTTALTDPQNTKIKADVVLVIEKSKELNVQRQKLKRRHSRPTTPPPRTRTPSLRRST